MTNKPAETGSGILIVGLPRSGTTWLGKIFDSHPYTLYRHEPDSWRRLTTVPVIANCDETDEHTPAIVAMYDQLPAITAQKVCGKRPIFPKQYFRPTQLLLFRAGASTARLGSHLGWQLPVTFGTTKMSGAMRLVWKSIESAGRLALLMRALPSLRAILLIRHPCGQIASIMRGEADHRFTDRTPSSDDYQLFEMLLSTPVAVKNGLTIEYLKSMTREERLAWRWAILNDIAYSVCRDNERCMAVRYDQLCADPETHVRACFEHAGLSWSGQTATFLRKSTSDVDDSYYSVYHNPLDSAGKWKKSLSPDTIDRILAITSRTDVGAEFLA